MAKQRRAAMSRSSARPATKKASSKAPRALRLSKGSSARTATKSKSSAVRYASKSKEAPAPPPVAVAPAPPPPPRKPAFYEALAIYETGVRALQRHDFAAAAESLRGVIQRYPTERELVERARLYLQVCERETARRPDGPQTPSESVYAATVALNSGDVEGALGHLGRALDRAPDNDHAHYIMAVALVDKGEPALAMVHLRHAISLNPENRSTALQDPDLGSLHDLEAFRQIVDIPDSSLNRRVRARQ